MVRKAIYTLIFIGASAGCSNKVIFFVKDKEYSCRQLPIEIINVPDKKNDLAFELIDTTLSKKNIRINFDSGFDNDVQTFINDSLIFNEHLKTNPSAGFTGKSILYDYSKNRDKNLILRIIIDNKNCIITNLNLKYYKLHIGNRLEKWVLSYNNNFVNYH